MSVTSRFTSYLNQYLATPGTSPPAFGSAGYRPGHTFVHNITGTRYINIGTYAYSMHVAEGVNRHTLRTNFPTRPGINANKAVPAGDTYNSAQMQLGLDKSADFEILGTNMTSALVTFTSGGGITLTTAGAATDSAILLPHLDTDLSPWTAAAWNTDRELSFRARIETDALIADETIWAGFKLTNTATTATDNDQVMFRFKDDASSGVWQAISSDDDRSGTATDDDVTATSGAVAISTAYDLLIQLDGNRVPRFYINGVLKATGLALNSNITLIPYIGILSDTSATAKVLKVRSLECGCSYA